jgi:hypothetical protein
MRFGDLGRCDGGDLALEQTARLGDLERADVEFLVGVRGGRGEDEHARSLARLDHALHFQRDHRLADRGPAYLEPFGQIAFRR